MSQRYTFQTYSDSHRSTCNTTTMQCQENDHTNKAPQNYMNHAYDHKNNQNESQLNRMRGQHHSKIRIRHLQQLRAQKRKEQLANKLIQQILNLQLPKQSNQCRQWSQNVLSLLSYKNTYIFQPYQLIQIFRLAQKFPNLNTLKLFRVAINKTEACNIKQLMNQDIFKFFHNLLQFPGIKNSQSRVNPQAVWQNHSMSYYTQPLEINAVQSEYKQDQSIKAYFIQLDTVKNVILTLSELYQKNQAMRKFSIQTHNTYDKVLNAFRTYKQDVKTQFIQYLLSTTQKCGYKSYNQNYIKIVKMVCQTVMLYRNRFNFQIISQKEEDQSVIQGIQSRRTQKTAIHKDQQFFSQKLKRSGLLIKTLKLFLRNKQQFMIKILQSENTKHNFLDIAFTYMKYGRIVLNITHLLNQEEYESFTTFLKETLEFFYTFQDKMTPMQYSTGNIDCYRQIIEILSKIRQKHQHLQIKSKSNTTQQQNKLRHYNQNNRNIEDIRKCCYFSISNGIFTVGQSMQTQFRNIVFFTKPSNNPNQPPKTYNLVEQLSYWIDAQFAHSNQHEVFFLALSVLRYSFITQIKNQIKRLFIIEKLLERAADSLLYADQRIFIYNQICQFVQIASKRMMYEDQVYFFQLIYSICKRIQQKQSNFFNSTLESQNYGSNQKNPVNEFLQALLQFVQTEMNRIH